MVGTGHNNSRRCQVTTGKRRVGYHVVAAKQQRKGLCDRLQETACLLAFVFVAWIPLDIASAQQSASQPTELGKVRRQIGAEQRRIEQAGQQREALLAALARSEQQANVVNSRVRQFAQALREKQLSLETLRARRTGEAQRLAQARAELARRLRATHRGGRGETLKLLLNLEDPAVAARALAYHTYATRRRTSEITAIIGQIEKFAGREKAIKDETDTLALLHSRAGAARDQLEVERQRRSELIKALDQQLASAADRIGELRRAERDLLTLVKSIRARENVLEPTAQITLKPFASDRGQMLWPTRGRLASDFSSRANSDQLHWQGVFIAAPAGQPVHAVAPGRVAFADWIRGFGLVVILEHEGEFMSLYGHARELLTEPGTWVDANEVIAAVGDTGGLAKTGLYFEVRKSGTPQNPRQWCQGLPRNRPATIARR